jgi:hypothetical protein
VEKQLPLHDVLDVAAFSRLFDDKTNSYKFLFFRSLLDCIEIGEMKPGFDGTIPLAQILKGLLINAWYPYSVFKLNFGTQDQIGRFLNELPVDVAEKLTDTSPKNKQDLYEIEIDQNSLGFFKRYVPFRLLNPFFADLRESPTNEEIPRLANERSFSSRLAPPLYRFDSDAPSRCKNVIVDQIWMDYLRRNKPIIESWFAWNWLMYMQRRNPYTPELHMKLFRPIERGSLNAQTKFWKDVMLALAAEGTEFRCIYSGEILPPDKISLDHFLPWSFIGHDENWNLIPTTASVNSSKSDNLPHEDYFLSFIERQFAALDLARKKFSSSRFDEVFEAYSVRLSIGLDEVTDAGRERFMKAYEKTMQPLFMLARNQKFREGWRLR